MDSVIRSFLRVRVRSENETAVSSISLSPHLLLIIFGDSMYFPDVRDIFKAILSTCDLALHANFEHNPHVIQEVTIQISKE